MFNILISSASRKVSLIKSFEKALKSLSLKGKVYVADVNFLASSLYYVKDYVICPRTDDKKYPFWLEKFCREKNIKLIIPSRDEELSFFAAIKDDFREKGIFINISNTRAVNICRDKEKFLHFCQKKNFPYPKIYKNISKIRYPCFIKGRFSKGSRSAFKVANKKQLKAFLAVVQKPIVQEYLDWPEYTIDYFADFKTQPISVTPRERIYTFGGESFIGKTLKDKFLIEKIINFAQGLKLMGHNTIQLFYDQKNKKLKFSEVNPRYGGGASLGIAAGVNTPLFLIKLILGQPITYKLYDFEDNLYMLRYTQDIFVKGSNIKK